MLERDLVYEIVWAIVESTVSAFSTWKENGSTMSWVFEVFVELDNNDGRLSLSKGPDNCEIPD